MKKRPVWRFALLILALLTMPALASGQQPEQDVDKAWEQSASLYEKLYARGLQDFAEGRYGRAVDSLQRAYAHERSAVTLKLIIRAYDAMGHCDAAARQRAFFSDAHPDQRAPRPRECTQPVEITLECEPIGTPVRIDRVMSSACGQTLSLPAGRHLFATVNQRSYVMYEVEKGQQTLVLDTPAPSSNRAVARGDRGRDQAAGRGGAARSESGTRGSSQDVALVGGSRQEDRARLICSGGSFGPSRDCIEVADDEVADVSDFSQPLLYIESPRNSENYVPTICYEGDRVTSEEDPRECVTIEKGASTRTCCSVDRVD